MMTCPVKYIWIDRDHKQEKYHQEQKSRFLHVLTLILFDWEDELWIVAEQFSISLVSSLVSIQKLF